MVIAPEIVLLANLATTLLMTDADEHGKRPTSERTREWLLTEASVAQDSAFGFTGDPDDFPEPMLWLALLDEP